MHSGLAMMRVPLLRYILRWFWKGIYEGLDIDRVSLFCDFENDFQFDPGA